MGDIAKYILPGLAAAAALVWLIIIVKTWAPAARTRGGYWYLEALFLTAGPAAMLTTALENSETGLAPVAARAGQGITLAVVSLALLALVRAHKTPRRGTGWFVLAVCAYYGSLYLSAAFGVIPSLPTSYTVTPLIVLAVLCHGGYTFDWLVKTGLVALRIAVVASFAVILVLPEMAFNLEESRTLFGINRLAGIAGHPNGLAALAAVGLLLELRSGSRLYWKLLFVGALLLAQSSTGYVIAAVGLAIIVWTSMQTVRTMLIMTGVGLGIASLFFLAEAQAFLAVALGGDALTFNGRERIWDAAMYGFTQNPVFGYGPELLNANYRYMFFPGFDAASHAHNQFIQTVASSGIVGVAALTLLLMTLLVAAFRTAVATRGLTLALVAFLLLRCISETPLKPGGASFSSFTIALIVSLLALAWTEREGPLREPSKPAQLPFIHSRG